MATHASVPAWRIPGTAELGGLPSMGSHRVRHGWSDLAAATAGLQKRGCGWKDCPGEAVSKPPTGQRPGCWKEPSKTLQIWGPAVFNSSSSRRGNTDFGCGHCEASDQGPLISSDSKECFCFCERIWGSEVLRLVLVSMPLCLSPGEVNANPLRDSCLENPMDRRTWRAAVDGVTKSRTRLSNHHSFAVSESHAFHTKALILMTFAGFLKRWPFSWMPFGLDFLMTLAFLTGFDLGVGMQSLWQPCCSENKNLGLIFRMAAPVLSGAECPKLGPKFPEPVHVLPSF